MSDVACPMCCATSVHRSKRAGFREEVLLRFLFARPYRCRKCHTRFYRAGHEVGLNLWVQERGNPDGAIDANGGEAFGEETPLSSGVPARPPAFWLETEEKRNAAARGPHESPDGQMEMRFDDLDDDEPEADEFLSSSAEPADPRRRHRTSRSHGGRRGYQSHTGRQSGMSRQTKLVVWILVVLLLSAAAILYLFSLFSNAAKKQKLVWYNSGASQVQIHARRNL